MVKAMERVKLVTPFKDVLQKLLLLMVARAMHNPDSKYANVSFPAVRCTLSFLLPFLNGI